MSRETQACSTFGLEISASFAIHSSIQHSPRKLCTFLCAYKYPNVYKRTILRFPYSLACFFMRLFCSFTSDFPTPAISTYSTHEKQKGRERRTRREEKWIWWRTYTHNNDISRPVVILDRGVTRSRPPCGQLRKRSQSSSLVIL